MHCQYLGIRYSRTGWGNVFRGTEILKLKFKTFSPNSITTPSQLNSDLEYTSEGRITANTQICEQSIL